MKNDDEQPTEDVPADDDVLANDFISCRHDAVQQQQPDADQIEWCRQQAAHPACCPRCFGWQLGQETHPIQQFGLRVTTGPTGLCGPAKRSRAQSRQTGHHPSHTP